MHLLTVHCSPVLNMCQRELGVILHTGQYTWPLEDSAQYVVVCTIWRGGPLISDLIDQV